MLDLFFAVSTVPVDLYTNLYLTWDLAQPSRVSKSAPSGSACGGVD